MGSGATPRALEGRSAAGLDPRENLRIHCFQIESSETLSNFFRRKWGGMLDDVFKERTAPESGTRPPEPPRERSRFLAPAVLLPAVFLLLIGMTVTFFGLLSFDRKTPFDLLREVRTTSGEKGVLAAYELSDRKSVV